MKLSFKSMQKYINYTVDKWKFSIISVWSTTKKNHKLAFHQKMFVWFRIFITYIDLKAECILWYYWSLFIMSSFMFAKRTIRHPCIVFRYFIVQVTWHVFEMHVPGEKIWYWTLWPLVPGTKSFLFHKHNWLGLIFKWWSKKKTIAVFVCCCFCFLSFVSSLYLLLFICAFIIIISPICIICPLFSLFVEKHFD